MHKKTAVSARETAVMPLRLLCLLGCFYRAGSCASATFDALICVDLVLAVAFGDSFYRAFCCASAAADASITNYICHTFFLL